jgi:WD40 repeat protein
VGPTQGRGGGASSKVNLLATLTGHTKTVSSLACSLKRQQLFSGSADGSIRIWGWPEGNFGQVGALEVGIDINSLMVEDDWLIAGIGKPGEPNVVRIWNMETSSQQDLLGHEGPIFAITQGNGMLFSAGHDAGIRCWKMDPSTMQFALVGVLQGHTAAVQCVQVQGATLFSCARDNTIKQWDLTTGQGVLSIPTGHTEFMMSLKLHETHLFSAGLDGSVFVYDTTKALAKVFSHVVTNRDRAPSPVTAMEICSDSAGSAILVVACSDNAMKLWEVPSFDRRGILLGHQGHSQPCRALCLGPGNSFFSAGMDTAVKVWEFE